MKNDSYLKKLLDSYKSDKRTFVVFMVLHTLVILTAIRCLITKNYESFATCILVLLLYLIGAVVFSIIGYTTLKTSKSSKVADSLMIRPNDHDE